MSLSSRLGQLATNRVIAIFVLASVLPLALLTYLSVTLGDHGLRSQAERRLEGVSSAAGKFVNEELSGEGAVVESFAGRTAVSDSLATRSKPESAKTVGDQLNDLLAAHAGTSVTFATDASGHLVAGRPDNPANVGQDYSFRDWYKGVVASGETYVSDSFVSAAPGSPAVVAIATPVRNSNGQIVGYIGANYSLSALQTLIRDFAKSQSVQITVTDRQGKVVASPADTTPTATSLTNDPGVAAALSGNASVTEVKRDKRQVLAAYSPVDRLGWSVIAEVPSHDALAPVNSLRIAILSGAAALTLVLFAGIGMLVLTLRERARIASDLQSSEESTRAILNASTDAYITMDAAGRVTTWSDQATRTFGWSADETLGRTVAELLVPPESRSLHREGIERFLRTGESQLINQRAELEALHKDGHRFTVELALWATGNDEQTVFSAFAHDITERRRAAVEVAAARDRAMEASRLKSEFVANMSHEIRTPMNGVIGMTTLLLRTTLSQEQREYTETIRHSAEALLDVINDILDFSKIEAGRMELDSLRFDLRSIVEEAGELIAGAAQAKGLELTVSIDPDIPLAVRGDPVRLRQILLNLLGNAVKFTQQGEVALRCFIVDFNERDQVIRFEVRDTGVGIHPEDRSKLFQSFSQLDTSSTRNFGGTGLGLVISKRLVELMGGAIDVESALGEGSTFWFTARFARVEDEAVPQPIGTSLANRHILVVDDNATNRTILQRTLASWGARVTTATSAEEALRSLHLAVERNNAYDIALIDYNMPGANGVQLGQSMAAEGLAMASTKRILLTSSGERGEATAAWASGFVGVLTKPVRQSALFDCLVSALGDTPRSDGPQAVVEPEATPGTHILLAEDNPVNQTVTRRMLEKMGYEVEVVSNGQEAVEAVERADYAVVLMDCQMPVLDGYGATAAIRANEDGAQHHLPIIAITAHAMEGDAEKCLNAGMDDYLSKPVSWDDLQHILLRWTGPGSAHLERARSARDGATEGPDAGSQSGSTAPAAGPNDAPAPVAIPAVSDDTDQGAEDEHVVDVGSSSSTVEDLPVLEEAVFSTILQLGTGEPDDPVHAIIETFVRNTTSQLDALEDAVQGGDRDEVRALAHRLKGSCATFGAARMSHLCAEMEEGSGDAEHSPDVVRVERLRSEFDEVQEALRTHLAVTDPPA